MRQKQATLSSIRTVIRQIVDAFHPRKIVLFGSYAHGQPRQRSDVDLLIVMPSKKRAVDRAIEVTKALRFYPFPMDIMVRTPAEVQRRLRMGDPFFTDVMAKGKLLYES